ncbi:hypothetical protein D3C80_1284640 [compost metagenome]
MAAQLLQVIGCSALTADAAAALFQVQQRYFGSRFVAFTDHLDEHMLAVQAAMLPMATVHTRQVLGQVLQHALMQGRAVTLARTVGVPVVAILEAVQGLADQQGAPLMLGITLDPAINDMRHPHTQLLEAVERIIFTQHRRAAERVHQTAVDMANLTFGIQHLTIFTTQPLYPAFPTPALVGSFDPLTLLLPEVVEPVVPRHCS